MDLDEFAWLGGGDGAPGVPGDLEDHECDRESDQRVGDWCAEADGDGAGDDAEGDVAVGAGVVAVGDQGGAGESAAAAESDLGGELVAEEADQAGGGEHPEVRQVLRVDEAEDRFVERDAGGDEDGEHDGEAGELLGAEGAQVEGDPERDGGERVAEVVDQVGEQRDRAGEGKDRDLRACGESEDGEADRDGLDAGAGADDRAVDETVRVAVLAMFVSALDQLVRVGVGGVVGQDVSRMRSA